MSETPAIPDLSRPDARASYPLLLTFEYEEVIRPCDFGGSNDDRSLAVGFVALSVICASGGQCLGKFDLNGQVPPGFYGLFGLSRPEPWGVWSDGKRTGIVLDVPQSPQAECRIAVEYQMQRPGPAHIYAGVYVNGIAAGRLLFEGTSGRLEFAVPAQALSWASLARRSNVSLYEEAQPELSIIVINYNRWELTFASLLFLLASEIRFAFEVIVVDNGSDAAEFSALRNRELPIKLVRLAERRSFGEANNFAAERARGSNLLLLNNDAFVQPHCISRLSEALWQVANGAAAPVLEYPDGRLQEAGGFINVDGSTLHRSYSNFQGLVGELPSISMVEYASAACLMIQRADFMRLGGFDPAYEPAYNEDADFCCRLRAVGKRVALVRDAKAVHLRNATLKTLSSTDPLTSAPARSSEIFRSRWGRWLWTRDSRDLPAVETVVFENGKAKTPGAVEKRVNAVISAGPLREDADTQALLALSGALAAEAPTLICTPTPYSRLRLLHLARSFSLPDDRVATADEASLGANSVNVLVHATTEIPPPQQDHGSRRILYCPMPVRAATLSDSETRARLHSLQMYETVVTNSELARQKLVEMLQYIGTPALPLALIHPPILEAQDVEADAKEDLIVCVGPFRRDASGGLHSAVLGGFKRFQADSRHRNWQLVCVGESQTQEELACLIDLRARAATWPVRFLLMPTKQQKSELLARAKICISAQAFGLSQHHEDRLKPYSAVEIGNAVSYGCVPLVPDGGVEAEMCDTLGVGFRFHRAEDIEQQLALAAAMAAKTDIFSHLHRRIHDFSPATFHRKWQKVLGYTGGLAADLLPQQARG